MEILKIVPASWTHWDSFEQYLYDELLRLKEKGFSWKIEPLDNGLTIISCDEYPDYLSASEALVTYRHFFSTAVADYIVEELERELITGIIKQDFGYMLDSQINNIVRYSEFLLSAKEEQDGRDELKIVERKCKIFKKAYEYLDEEREFNFNGFLRFRLKDYYEELTKVVEYAIEEYILDQEYQEFIQLLRFFISKQESKMSFLHVYHVQDRQFILYNEQEKIVTDEELQKFMQNWSDESISYEDIIVSTLISINPESFTLHTNEPNHSVIQTIKNIFENRVQICTQCQRCKQWSNARCGLDSKARG